MSFFLLMAITDTILLAIFCLIFGYQLGCTRQTQDTATQTEEEAVPTSDANSEAQWVGLDLHSESSDDDSTQRPLDNLPQGSLPLTVLPPRNSHGGQYNCQVPGCSHYAVHPSPRCNHLQCKGHHCLRHCHTLCCPYRPPRLYSS